MHEVFHFKSRAPRSVIGTDEVIDLGGVTVEIVHTPGHTPGHMALLFRKLRSCSWATMISPSSAHGMATRIQI